MFEKHNQPFEGMSMTTKTAMTPAERKARRADLRFQTISQRTRSRLSSIVYVWERAEREHWTHAQLLEYRKTWIHDTGYAALPTYAKSELSGAWDACQMIAYRTLVFCYPSPADGVITPSKTICNNGLASQLSSTGLDKQGNHYWPNTDGTFSDPF